MFELIMVKEKDGKEKESKDEESEEKEKKLTDIPGIGPGVAAKLDAAGIYDLMGLAVMTPTDLSELAGVGQAVARKAIQAIKTTGIKINLWFMSGKKKIIAKKPIAIWVFINMVLIRNLKI